MVEVIRFIHVHIEWDRNLFQSPTVLRPAKKLTTGGIQNHSEDVLARKKSNA